MPDQCSPATVESLVVDAQPDGSREALATHIIRTGFIDQDQFESGQPGLVTIQLATAGGVSDRRGCRPLSAVARTA